MQCPPPVLFFFMDHISRWRPKEDFKHIEFVFMCRYSWLLFPFKMLSMRNSKVSKCHMETFLQGRVSTWHLPFLCLLLFTVQISTRVCSHSSALFLFLNGPRPLQRMCFMNRFHNVHFVSLKDESRLLLTRQTWQWINVLHFTVWLQLYLQTFFFHGLSAREKLIPASFKRTPQKSMSVPRLFIMMAQLWHGFLFPSHRSQTQTLWSSSRTNCQM